MLEERAIIDIIQYYPFIYNKSRADYKDNSKKQNAWLGISQALGAPVEDCQRAWKNLRDRYARERRGKRVTHSGMDAETVSDWPYYQSMMFMERHIQTRNVMTEPSTMYDLPDDVTEKLLCSHCNAYLSCGPVKLQPDGGTTCGRCSQPTNEDSTPQVLFEVAMAKFTFPCRYKEQGCKKRVLFNHAIEHERECAYRTVCCPSLPYNNCLKEVSVFDVDDHFKKAHAELILKNGKFKLEFKQDVQCNLIMAKDNVIVVVQYIYDSIKKILFVDVKHFSQDGKKDVYCKLQIISGCDSDSTVNLKERKCDLYESHILNMQSAAHLIMDNYLPVLENPNFIYVNIKLTVNIKHSSENNVPSTIISKTQSLNEYEEKALVAWNALEHIRCTTCKLFIIPPVMTVSNYGCAENYCSECSVRYNARENKIEIKNFPCRWRDCTFMGNDSNIKQHVESCQFRTFFCPVSSMCTKGYFTLNNLKEHMQGHGTHCPNPKRIVINLFGRVGGISNSKVYFTLFESRLIAFTCYTTNWRLTSEFKNLSVDIYFEHDHCRFKSKTFTFSNQIDTSLNNHFDDFPKCFNSCRRISAVLSIANKVK